MVLIRGPRRILPIMAVLGGLGLGSPCRSWRCWVSAPSAIAPRDSRRHFYVLPALACLTFLVPYAVLSPENSQARFLMPAYALLIVPAAYFIVWAATQTRNTALPRPTRDGHALRCGPSA
jgi:hypothetical protein